MKFDSLMSSFPSLLKKAFQPPECKITSDYIQDLFIPDFSARGSNSRNKEEVNNDDVDSLSSLATPIIYTGQGDDGSPNLKDVVFITGCESG